LKLLIKLLISIFLLYLVFKNIEVEKILTLLFESNFFWITISFLFYNLSKILSSIRLNFYFKDLGINLNQWSALKLYYLGMFYNLFLPGGVGGDGYKIYLLQKNYKVGYKPLFWATLLDRLSGLVALLFLFGLLFLFSPYTKLWEGLKWIDLALLLLLYPLFFKFQTSLFPTFNSSFLPTTILGLGVQLLQLLSAFFLLKALPQAVDVITFLTLFLLSSIMAVLPLSVGGVGMREFTFLYGLKLLGEDASLGVTFSFLFFLISTLSSAIGILFSFRDFLNR